MRNERVEAFESQLGDILKEIDRALEEAYGATIQRHPARPAEGQTAHPQYDGAFAVIANFSAGIGSRYGAGYTLTLRIATLCPVNADLQTACEALMVKMLRQRLPEVFPNRKLSVEHDNYGWKLFGDLSLD
ncbi:MAG: hypothetical protein IJV69_04290 [Kiritimatiellae bacterium]|nr:hypothetical protein [Kiritimatiellia bacterium]